MTGSIGKQYLKDYLVNSGPLFEKYLQKKIDEAGKISKIPAELLKRFLETARRGKKIRGALTVLGYEACGGKDRMAILDAGLSIELLHAGLLVHDDFMDQDKLRRGLPSLHEQFSKFGGEEKVKADYHHYGETMAVIAGDAAFYLSWETLLQSSFPPDRLARAGEVYAKYVVRTAYGQAMDLSNTPLTGLNNDYLLSVLRLKSAEYTGVLPLLLGAALAGETSEKRLKAIESFGLAFGWAFQIQDDLLDITADESKFGKFVGGDLVEGKKTYLFVKAFEVSSGSEKEMLRKVIRNKGIKKNEVVKYKSLYEKLGVIENSKNEIKKYTSRALDSLKLLKRKEDRELFNWLADNLITRSK